MAPFVLALARSRPAGWLVRTTFAHAPWVLPLRRLDESPTVLAFAHPLPIATPHILLVPRRSLRSVLDVRYEDAAALTDLVAMARCLAAGHQDLLLVINGGASQDVAQLHAHLLPASAVTFDAFPTRIELPELFGWPLVQAIQRAVAARALERPGFSVVLDPTGNTPARVLSRRSGD